MDAPKDGNRMESMDIKRRLSGLLSVMVLVLMLTGVTHMHGQKSPLLWKVENPITGGLSYIFGTYHLVGSDYLKENKPVEKAYENARVVVVETVIDSSALLGVAMKGMMLDNSLENLVDSADYYLLKTELEAVLGMPIEQLSNFKPIMISTMYSLAKAQEATPENFNFGGIPIDLYFADNGKKQGKEIVALETAMEQAEILFDSQTLEEQAQALVENVKAEVEDDLSNEVLEAYMSQDLDALWKLNENWDESMGEMTLLLDERNKKWIPKLKPLLDKGDVFIAVGALHLPGEVGILELLREEGYKVKPVKNH